jgi:hypothetical protein
VAKNVASHNQTTKEKSPKPKKQPKNVATHATYNHTKQKRNVAVLWQSRGFLCVNSPLMGK